MRNITFGVLVWMTISCHLGQAQSYWVVETNLHQKNFTIVKFYNDQHMLIYEQKQGEYFDLSKKKHKRRLDSMLENYLSSGSPISKKEAKRKSSKQF